MVKVTLHSGETKDLPFAEGKTTQQYLTEAFQAALARGQSVSVNGKRVAPDTVIDKDGSSIILAADIANG